MQYVEAIGTLIVIFIIPAVIVCGIVGAPNRSRRAAGGSVRTADGSRGPQP
jgi:hypothetical protein